MPGRREGHAEAIGHGRGFELRIGAQRANRAGEKLAARIFARIGAFHQGEARGIKAILVVAVIELGLVADRFDLQGRGDEERGGQRNLSDHEHAGDDIDEAAAVAAPAFFHHFSRVAARAEKCREQTGDDGRDERDRESENENAAVDRESPPVGRRKRRGLAPLCRTCPRPNRR